MTLVIFWDNPWDKKMVRIIRKQLERFEDKPGQSNIDPNRIKRSNISKIMS